MREGSRKLPNTVMSQWNNRKLMPDQPGPQMIGPESMNSAKKKKRIRA
jgi:hypothetical protein